MSTPEDVVVNDLQSPTPAPDSSRSYMEYRTQLAEAAALDEMRRSVETQRDGEQSATPAEPEQDEPSGEPTFFDEDSFLVGPMLKRRREKKEAAEAAGDKSRSVKADVGLGIIEAPRAIVSGVVEAANDTLALTEELGNFLENKLPLGGVGLDRDAEGNITGASFKPPGEEEFSGIDLPNLPEPESVTGNLIKGVSQFTTGMLGAGKIKMLKNLQGLGGSAARGFVADFAAFDADEGRLADLLADNPSMQNPVMEFLQTSPDDSEAVGRLKNGLEGLGLGVALDGFVLSLRALRQQRITRRQALIQANGPTKVPVNRELEADAFRILGDPKGKSPISPLIKNIDESTTPKKGPEQFVNWARIDTDEDVIKVMDEFVARTSGNIDEARRGVQTFKQIKLNADQENGWKALFERRVGEPLNAEQSVAARQLWVASAEKLKEVAQLAADSPSEANLFAFRKMTAVHFAIQNQVIATRTETARALASWRIPSSAGAEQLNDIAALLDQGGGEKVTRLLAERISALGNAGMYREMDDVMAKTMYAKTRDAVIEAWIMGLLSGPKTHMVNMMSNTSVIGMQMYERGVAAQLARLLGDEGSVAVGEGMAQWFGMIEGFKDGMRYAAKTARTGETGFGIGNKVDAPQIGSISSEAFNISNSGWLGQAVDGLGTVVRLPGRALAAEDEFFKTIGYRMELNAQSLRQARDEVRAGHIQPEQLKARIEELKADPPQNLHMAAVDAALYQTFTNKSGDFGQWIMRGVNTFPNLRVLVPFVRTPANILHFSFERTPLAPLMSSVRADIKAGGARRDLALARMGTGTAVMLASVDMALSGSMSGGGPVDPAQRQTLLRSGWQPYSVKFGDRWYAYNRLDPMGMLLGVSADMVELSMNTDWSAEEARELEAMSVALAASIGNNVMNKTYLSTLSQFFEALGDPTRYSETFAHRMAGSVVPTGIAEIRRIDDPYMREVRSMVDAMRNRTPGLSDNLPVRRDLWGRPISYQSGLTWAYDAFSPIYSRKEDPEPIDSELLSGGDFSSARIEGREVAEGNNHITVSMPNKRTSFNGVTVNLDLYEGAYGRYLELAGNELKHIAWDMGAKDLLNAIVTGRHDLSQVYDMKSDGPDGEKEAFIRDIVNQYRKMARTQLLEEYPDMRRDVGLKQEQKRELRLPTIN